MSKILVLLVFFSATLARGESTPVDMELVVGVGGDIDRFKGHLTINVKREQCFYLAYADPRYGQHRHLDRRLDIHDNQRSESGLRGGTTSVRMRGNRAQLDYLTPFLVRVRVQSSGPTTLLFDGTAPRLPGERYPERLFEGFYPKSLKSCPAANQESLYYEFSTDQTFRYTIKHPTNWSLIAPGIRATTDSEASIVWRAREVAFALTQGATQTSLNIGRLKVRLHYFSKSFLDIIPTLRFAVRSHSEWLGNIPNNEIAIVETSDLQRGDLPGLIAVDRPRQQLFQSIQSNWLNWSHWNFVHLVAQQWWGGYLSNSNPDERWFIRGFTDFVTLKALQSYSTRFNLYSVFDVGNSLISLNYREAQDLEAALLYKNNHAARITDRNFNTLDSYNVQDSHLPARHAIALRQISSQLNEKVFKQIVKNFSQVHTFRWIRPVDFYNFLGQLPSPASSAERTEMQANLATWWTQSGWPDYELRSFQSEKVSDGQWTTRVKYGQLGEIDFPVSIQVTDTTGKSHIKLGRLSRKNEGEVTFKTGGEVETIEIDPLRSVFDSDRYNNTNKWPDIRFLPGSANSIPDDGYTVVWFPYPFRRPGEPWSLSLDAGVFRYLNGGVTANVETELGTRHRTAVNTLLRKAWPKYGLSSETSFRQNIYGSRLMELSAERSPVIPFGPKVGLKVMARQRQVVGQSDTTHQTTAFGLNSQPWGQSRFCGYRLNSEYEAAPRSLSPDFPYERKFFIADGFCNFFQYADLSLRFFRGEMSGSSSVPDELLFNPENIIEAGLRLDVSSLQRVRQLYSIKSDVFFPLLLPIPGNTYILAQHLKLRAFYDFGRSLDAATEYRASGTGILMPFGGDVSGIGSLAITRLSLLAVLYSHAEGSTSQKPRYLLDLRGQL